MGEILAAVVDFIGPLLEGGGGAAADLGAGAAAAGAADLGAAAGAGGIADLVGTGGALFGGATGLEGTALAGGAGLLDAGAIAGGTAGLGVLGTAADFLGAGAATGGAGFGAAADTAATTAATSGLASGTGDIAATPTISSLLQPAAMGGTTASSALSPNVANANAAASPFDTGTQGLPGMSQGTPMTAPSGIPGGGAAGASAPVGVGGTIDPTAAGAAAGPTSVGGAPLSGGSSSSISDLLNKAGSGAIKSLTSNPLGIALGAGGLGYNILQGQKNTKNQNALTADAQTATANSTQMVASGEAMQKYLTDGTLPPGYQTIVDQAINDAKTTAISNAAGQGQPTDPAQNTALAATLAKIDASKPQMQSQVASQLFSSGSTLVSSGQSAAGLSGQLYQALVANDTTQAANTGKAIATLAAAMNGKSSNTIGSTNISVSAA